jgi:multiple sugar transport system permease protein
VPPGVGRVPTAERSVPARCGRREPWLWVSNAPAVALVAAFSVLPLTYVVCLSFLDLRIGAPGGPAGWANYRFVLADASVRTAFGNTVYFSVLSVAVATVVGLGIALLLDSRALGAQWLVAGAVIPWAIPEIVNALIWQWIYSPTYGALNGVLVSLDLAREYRAWLSSPASAMHALVFAHAWKLVPFVVIILYAALRSVPAELYEAAQIDGAGDWGQLRHVSIPAISPAIVVAVTFCLVWSMRAFDIVYLLTKGGPGESTVLLSYLTFVKAFEFGDLGAGAAVACLLAALTLVLTLVYLRVLPEARR